MASDENECEGHESEMSRQRLGWEVRGIRDRLDHLHACFEKRDGVMRALLDSIDERVNSLEKVRERIIGMSILGSVVLLGVAGVLWAFFARWLPLMDAMGKLIEKGGGRP